LKRLALHPHLLGALRGLADADGDDQVSLAEAYTYTYRRTWPARPAPERAPASQLRREHAWGGRMDVRPPPAAGRGNRPRGGHRGHGLVASRDELVAEVHKVRGSACASASGPASIGWCAPGRFSYVADVSLAVVHERTLAPPIFVRTRASSARLRGADPFALRPFRMGWPTRCPRGSDPLDCSTSAPCACAAGRRLVRPRGLAGSYSAMRGEGVDIAQWTARLSIGVGRVVPIDVVDVGIGVDVRAALVSQSFDRDDGEDIERLFGTRTRSGPRSSGTRGSARTHPSRSPTVVADAGLRLGMARIPLYDGSIAARLAAEGEAGIDWSF